MRWTIGPAALAAIVGCAGPADPVYPDPSAIGPPPAVGDQCVPPFPMGFAQDWFVFADLDQGTSCDVFLEQDECAVGIYHDCTDGTADPREWQGRVSTNPNAVGYEPRIELVAKYEDPTSGSRLARGPSCCEGSLFPRGDNVVPTYALLTCHDDACDRPFETTHTGLYLERRTDFDPKSLDRGSFSLEAGARTPDASFAAGAVWVIVGSSVYTYTPETTNAERVPIDVGDAEHLVHALGGGAVYTAGASLVRIDTAARTESARIALPGPADAVVPTSAGLLVAYADGATSGLALYDPVSLAPRGAPRLQAERVTGLAAVEDLDRIAVATAEGSSALFAVTSTLTLGVLVDIAQDGALSTRQVVPFAPFSVSGSKVGMLGRCYEAAPKVHCYFEIDTADASVRRVGVPDVEVLVSAAYDIRTDRIVASSAGGRIAFIDRGAAFRPRVQQTVRLDGTPLLGAIAIDAERGVAYVAETLVGSMRVIAEPGPG